MNRLGTRLILAMLLVALFSASVIVLSQFVGARLHFQTLPAEVQADILARRARESALQEALERGDEAALEDLIPPRSPGTPPPDTVEREVFLRGLSDVQDYQRRATWVGLGVAALLATLTATLLARVISRPIERVAEAAAGVAEGDLGVRVAERPGAAGREVRALTENFNAMANALETYERERKAMIADIAHELRTPLTAMKLRFQALEDDLIPFDKGEVARLHRQADLLSRLVHDLRTLSLADAGKLSLQRRETDLVALVGGVLESYRAQAETQGVELRLRPTDPSLRADVDADRIAQIVGNLLDNALRVTPAGGRVEVHLEDGPEGVALSVSDTGPGLSEEALEHLFDRFYQDRDTKGSSGLGLAIVQALTALHGGRVQARNEGGGARFDVLLPRSAG